LLVKLMVRSRRTNKSTLNIRNNAPKPELELTLQPVLSMTPLLLSRTKENTKFK
jgi:hypothetical protein